MIDFASIWDRMTGGAPLTSPRRTGEEAENRPPRGATAPRCSFGGIVPDDTASFAGEAISPSRGPVSGEGLSYRVPGGRLERFVGGDEGLVYLLRPDGEDDTLGDAPIPRDDLLKATIDELQGVVGRQAAEIDRLFKRAGDLERTCRHQQEEVGKLHSSMRPRRYDGEERERASSALQAAEYRTGVKFEEMVDAVAEALGMRKAGA